MQNGITKYLNHLFSEAERTFSTRNNNYGNLSENWCIDGNTGFTVIYYFENGKFVKKSNGFKIRAADAQQYWNNKTINSNIYIYAAFAENPFKNSLAR